MNLLFLDENSIASELDHAGFKKRGINIFNVSSVEDISLFIMKTNIDAFIINLQFEDEANVIQKLQYLKSQRSTTRIPIIISYVEMSDKHKSLFIENGADLIIQQPIPREAFLEEIKIITDQKIRESKRVNINNLGKAEFSLNGNEYKLNIIDISMNGIFLETSELLEINKKINLNLVFAELSIEVDVSGEIVRHINPKNSQSHKGIGIRFLNYSSDSKGIIESVISKYNCDNNLLQYYL